MDEFVYIIVHERYVSYMNTYTRHEMSRMTDFDIIRAYKNKEDAKAYLMDLYNSVNDAIKVLKHCGNEVKFIYDHGNYRHMIKRHDRYMIERQKIL